MQRFLLVVQGDQSLNLKYRLFKDFSEMVISMVYSFKFDVIFLRVSGSFFGVLQNSFHNCQLSLSLI